MATAAEGWKRGGLIRGPGIPAPSGQYQVGCINLMHKFVDDTDTLLVRLFYPCQEGGGRYEYGKWIPHKKYLKGYLKCEYTKRSLPGVVSTVVGLFIDPQIPALYGAPFFTGKETYAKGGEVVDGEVNDVTSEAPPTSDLPLFPVMVFSHGLGVMSLTYSATCCDVASHGYIVASVEHRDRSASVSRLRVPKPRGKEEELIDKWLKHYFPREGEKKFPVRNEQVKKRAADARRALDLLGLLNEGSAVGNLMGENFDFSEFKGRLDLDRAGIMGHSFGGATTIQTLREDQRFKCGVCLDAWMQPINKELYENGSVVQQPLIFINSYDFQWKRNIQQMTQMTKPPNAQGISTSRIVTLIGTNHYYQSDFLFVVPSWLRKPQVGSLELATAHRINMDITHAFFRRHLLLDPIFQGPIPNLDGCEGHSEHILFGSNVDITEPQVTEQTSTAEEHSN